jgi:hypothetical protein
MKNQKGFAVIIILTIVALVMIGGSGYYIYNQLQQKKTASPISQPLLNQQAPLNNNGIITTTKTVEANNITNNNGSKIEGSIKIDITQTVDCGSEDCFKEKFITCQPSTLKADGGLMGVAYYRIIGPDIGGCKMVFKYTASPNPDWVNKEMICVFDNKIDFQKSIENTFDGIMKGSIICSGPLYTILHSIGN